MGLLLIGVLSSVNIVIGIYVLVGLYIVWSFKLPVAFGVLPLLLPGFSILYLLIYGQLREERQKMNRPIDTVAA